MKAISSVFESGVANVVYLSNGVVLPYGVLHELELHRDNAMAQIDLHSLDEDYYTWFTGVSNILPRIKHSIRSLVSNKVPVFVAMIVIPRNLQEIDCVAKWAHDVGAFQIGISPVIELGRAYGRASELMLTKPEEIKSLDEALDRVRMAYPEFLREAKDYKRLGRLNCGAIISHATIDYKGYIKICPMDSLPRLGKTLGNVLQCDIKKLFDKHGEFVTAFSNTSPPDMFDEQCSACQNALFCNRRISRTIYAAQSIQCDWYSQKVPDVIKAELRLRGDES